MFEQLTAVHKVVFQQKKHKVPEPDADTPRAYQLLQDQTQSNRHMMQSNSGIESVLFWWSTISKKMSWINYIYHNQQRFVHFSTDKVKGLYRYVIGKEGCVG